LIHVLFLLQLIPALLCYVIASIKGIGEKTAMNFLVEMGGDVQVFENDKKLIAAQQD